MALVYVSPISLKTSTSLNELKIPNTILDASDIPEPETWPHTAQTNDPLTQDHPMLVMQWIQTPHPRYAACGSKLQMRTDADTLPARVIVELLYGAACCLAWGQTPFLDIIKLKAQETYDTGGRGLHTGEGKPRRADRESYEDRHARGSRHRQSARKLDILDLLAAIVVRDDSTLRRPVTRDNVKPKVETWLNGITQAEDDPNSV